MSTNANMYITVDDLMNGRGVYLTSRGKPQKGIVFVCQEHGLQGFDAIHHAPLAPHGISLACGCFFVIDRTTGEVSK